MNLLFVAKLTRIKTRQPWCQTRTSEWKLRQWSWTAEFFIKYTISFRSLLFGDVENVIYQLVRVVLDDAILWKIYFPAKTHRNSCNSIRSGRHKLFERHCTLHSLNVCWKVHLQRNYVKIDPKTFATYPQRFVFVTNIQDNKNRCF